MGDKLCRVTISDIKGGGHVVAERAGPSPDHPSTNGNGAVQILFCRAERPVVGPIALAAF